MSDGNVINDDMPASYFGVPGGYSTITGTFAPPQGGSTAAGQQGLPTANAQPAAQPAAPAATAPTGGNATSGVNWSALLGYAGSQGGGTPSNSTGTSVDSTPARAPTFDAGGAMPPGSGVPADTTGNPSDAPNAADVLDSALAWGRQYYGVLGSGDDSSDASYAGGGGVALRGTNNLAPFAPFQAPAPVAPQSIGPLNIPQSTYGGPPPFQPALPVPQMPGLPPQATFPQFNGLNGGLLAAPLVQYRGGAPMAEGGPVGGYDDGGAVDQEDPSQDQSVQGTLPTPPGGTVDQEDPSQGVPPTNEGLFQPPPAGAPSSSFGDALGQVGDYARSAAQGVAGQVGNYFRGVAQQLGGGPARQFMRYLMGVDSVPPDQAQQLQQAVDPQGQMDPSDRNVAALVQAHQEGGPGAAFSFTQYLRKAADASKAHGAVALSRGDINNAVNSANMMTDYVPDGTKTVFQPAQVGGLPFSDQGNPSTDPVVTATVTKDGKVLGQAPLTADAFMSFLTGKPGLFDNVIEKSMLGALKEAQNTPPPDHAQTQQQLNVDANGRAPADLSSFSRPQAPQQRPPVQGSDLGTMNLAQVQQLSQRLFPAASQQAQRQKWVADTVGKQAGMVDARTKAQSPYGVAGIRAAATNYNADARAGAMRDVAGTNAQAKRDVALTQLQGLIQKAQQGQLNQQQSQLVRLLSAAMNPNSPNAWTPEQAMDFYNNALKQQGQQLAQPQPAGPATPATNTRPIQQPAQQAPQVKTPDDYAAVPPGGKYLDPQGNLRTKPAAGAQPQ